MTETSANPKVTSDSKVTATPDSTTKNTILQSLVAKSTAVVNNVKSNATVEPVTPVTSTGTNINISHISNSSLTSAVNSVVTSSHNATSFSNNSAFNSSFTGSGTSIANAPGTINNNGKFSAGTIIDIDSAAINMPGQKSVSPISVPSSASSVPAKPKSAPSVVTSVPSHNYIAPAPTPRIFVDSVTPTPSSVASDIPTPVSTNDSFPSSASVPPATAAPTQSYTPPKYTHKSKIYLQATAFVKSKSGKRQILTEPVQVGKGGKLKYVYSKTIHKNGKKIVSHMMPVSRKTYNAMMVASHKPSKQIKSDADFDKARAARIKAHAGGVLNDKKYKSTFAAQVSDTGNGTLIPNSKGEFSKVPKGEQVPLTAANKAVANRIIGDNVDLNSGKVTNPGKTSKTKLAKGKTDKTKSNSKSTSTKSTKANTSKKKAKTNSNQDDGLTR